MHHALQIYEILADVFDYCYPLGTPGATSALSALARTCRAFKEPALDMLWKYLTDLSPLVRCLPEASHQLPAGDLYSFSRLLTETDWDILRSYTRRIRVIQHDGTKLDARSLRALSNAPTTVPLFPKLCRLRCAYFTEAISLWHMPLQSLTSLELMFNNPLLFHDYVKSFPRFSPNLKHFYLAVYQVKEDFIEVNADFFCQWQNLETLCSPEVALDVDTLVHLSRLPRLARLAYTLADKTQLDSLLCFPTLLQFHLVLQSESSIQVSRFLAQTRLPVATQFNIVLPEHPSKQDLSSLLADVQISTRAHNIENFSLVQQFSFNANTRSDSLLSLDDLRPCVAFCNLRCMEIDVKWEVTLTDSELLTLASAWPHLETLTINPLWGWNTWGVGGGITPNGLLQLLRTCGSLSDIALVIDTRGYTQFHEPPDRLGLTLPRVFRIDVLDSEFETESVLAMAAYFAAIARYPVSIRSWESLAFEVGLDEDSKAQWDDVCRRANEALTQRS